MTENNKVILIGSDHHNGLGLVRQFGINGIKPFGIIQSTNEKGSFVSKSKYWEKVWIIRDENELINVLMTEFSNERKKPVIIPWSDGMARLIDYNLDKLKDMFIVPSINGKKGAICELMDKYNQVAFCNRSKLKVLESKIYELDADKNCIDMDYPVVLKPVASIEGQKMDITVCYSESEFKDTLRKFKEKKYNRVLIQHYLEKRKEYVLTGAVCEDLLTFSVVSHIRQWPTRIGSGSFSSFEVDESVTSYANECLDSVRKAGYQGNIDIEFFSDENNNFYLNEINWRSSGRNFVSLYTGVYSAYQYFCKVTDLPVCGELINRKQGYTMNEATDLRYVIFKQYSIFDWLKDLIQTNCFAVWYRKDLKPVFVRYIYLIVKLVKRGKE